MKILIIALIITCISCKMEEKKEVVVNKKEKIDVVEPVATVPVIDQDSKQTRLESPPSQMEDFDFLIGDWTLKGTRLNPDGTINGEYKGTWNAQFIDDGRIILDNVTWFNSDGTKESFYPTLRTFSPETNRWEMTYMASLSYMHSESFRGQFIDGEGHFDAVVGIAPEKSVKAKVRFYNIKENSLDWSMKFSSDDGKSWFIARKFTAKRVL